MPSEPIVSRPYRPGEKCCEACVFGSGKHALWCEERSAEIVPAKIQVSSHAVPCRSSCTADSENDAGHSDACRSVDTCGHIPCKSL